MGIIYNVDLVLTDGALHSVDLNTDFELACGPHRR